MQTFQKTLIVKADHQVHIDLKVPDNFPIGEVEVCIILVPKAAQSSEKNAFLKLAGSLKDSKNFSGDPVKFQKKLRNEKITTQVKS